MKTITVDQIGLLGAIDLGEERTMLYIPTSARLLEIISPLDYNSPIRNSFNPVPIVSESGIVESLDVGSCSSGEFEGGGIRFQKYDVKKLTLKKRKIENWRLLACLDLRPYIGRPSEDESMIWVLDGFERKVSILTGLPEDRAKDNLLRVTGTVIKEAQKMYDERTNYSFGDTGVESGL